MLEINIFSCWLQLSISQSAPQCKEYSVINTICQRSDPARWQQPLLVLVVVVGVSRSHLLTRTSTIGSFWLEAITYCGIGNV